MRLQEQVLPILDLMSTMASPHVSKLKDFITMQLPSGFPVKIEIPLFHVLNACITFGNVFAMTTPVDNVSTINEDDRITCIVDDRCFEVPSNYIEKGGLVLILFVCLFGIYKIMLYFCWGCGCVVQFNRYRYKTANAPRRRRYVAICH